MRIGYDKNYYKNNAKVDFGGKRIGKSACSFVAHTECHTRIPLLVPVSLCLLLIFPLFAAAQDTIAAATRPVINVGAVVKPRHIQLGEKARLELTLSGDAFIEHIKAPRFNFLPAFLAVPLHSETVPHLKSDKIAVSMAWIYELIPQAVGDFTLSDIRFDYQGSLYFANPGAIRVSGTDTYQEALTGGVHQVEVEVDTEKPYLNAPFTYTFRYLYTVTLPTRESPTPRLPEFRDFFVEKLETPPPYTRQIRGKTFWVEEYGHKLYAKRAGQIVLAPAELLLPLPQGRRTLKTKPLTLTVQPLPEMGRPADFSGPIGEYQISAELERGWVEAGSALTLTVRVSGRGNLQVGEAPKSPTIPGVMVSGPNPSYNAMPTSMAYVYTLTPLRAGTLRIPAITYVYFDPNRATYVTIQTLPIPLSVRPNPNDLADIEDEDRSWQFWVALLLAILLVGGLIAGFFWYRARLQVPSSAASSTSIGAENSEAKDLNARGSAAEPTTPGSQAREAIVILANADATDAVATFANGLAQVLYQYLESTLALPQRNVEAVRRVGVQAQISDDILSELIDLLTKCDYHRFAPVPLSADERDALIARAEVIIAHIENLQNA